MSLPKPSEHAAVRIIKAQWRYKIKANFGMALSLLAAQMISMTFSEYSSGNPFLTKYSDDVLIIFTMLLIGVESFIMTTKRRRELDFTFVTNRMSGNLSTISYLLTLSVFAGITAFLFSLLARILIYFSEGQSNLPAAGFIMPPTYFLTGMTAAILYCILLSSVGFFFGSLFQNKLALLISIIGVIVIFIAYFSFGRNTVLWNTLASFLDKHLTGFFSGERSLWLFAVKALTTSAVLYAGGLLLTNRGEVER